MGVGPPAVTRSPGLRAPRVGSLISTARDGTADPLADGNGSPARWQNGYSYLHGGCGAETDILDPCATGAGREFGGEGDNAVVGPIEPFIVRAREQCSAFGFTAHEWEARARDLFNACVSDRIARELWRGDQARASEWETNSFLTNLEPSDVLTNGSTNPADALAMLEDALRHSCTCGQPVFIHATASVYTKWAENELVELVNGIYVTKLGTPVIVDSGYDGSGPLDDVFPDGEPTPAVDGSVWAYGTDLVSYKVDTPQVMPGNPQEAEAMAQALNRSTNTVTVFVEGTAAVDFPGCCHFAVEIDAPLGTVGGAGS